MTPQERDRLHKAVHARLSRGDSVKALAERAGISRSTLYTWTSPVQRRGWDPEWESFRRLADSLDMRMWELVREVEDGGVIRAFGPRRGER